MHTFEESDQRSSTCEAVEQGRAIACGVGGGKDGPRRTRPSIMHPTQSGVRVSQGLAGVRQAAKKGKQEKFTALLHHLTIDLLRDSYYALKR